MRVLSVGEVLWEVFPNREFLGGAPLNVCANCGAPATTWHCFPLEEVIPAETLRLRRCVNSTSRRS